MKESELFEPVKSFLLENGCSEVYGEVLNYDVLGINGVCDIIVELKRNLNFKLIDQAIDRLDLGQYVYIAIPKRKEYTPICIKQILKDKKIGLLEIEEGTVYITIPARFNHQATKNFKKGFKRARDFIRPYNKEQVGGVKGGEAITDYSIMIQNIKDFMQFNKHGKWVTVNEVLEHCETHYANPKPSLMATLQAEWNQKWCETKVENRKRYFRYKGDTLVN